MKNKAILLLSICLFAACKQNTEQFDATGVFEADEVIISAEATGKLLNFTVEEGNNLKKGQIVAQIDCEQIKLQKQQTKATYDAVSQKQNNANPQIEVLKQQLIPLQRQVETNKSKLKCLKKNACE